MKKKLLVLAILVFAFCTSSTKIFAQPAPGDGGGEIIDVTSTVPLTIDLGGAGVATVAPTSQHYKCIVSVLNYFRVPVSNGVVNFKTFSCYSGSLSLLYCSNVISYNTMHTACNNPPSGCRR